MKKENHHLFYPRRSYRTSQEKLLRQSEGFVQPIFEKPHKELHCAVEPPQKPSKWLTERLIDFTHDDYEANSYDKLMNIIYYLGAVANNIHCDEIATEAYNLHNNFIKQYHYIDTGRIDDGHL